SAWFCVRLSVHFEIRHLLPAEPKIVHPAFGHAARQPAADILQQAIIVGPLGDRQRSEPFKPTLLPRHPTPSVEGSHRRWQRLDVHDLFSGQTQSLALPDDELHVSMLGVVVFDDFAVLMLENFLLHRHMRAVTRHMRPTVAAVMNKKTKLGNQDLGARFGYFDFEIMIQLRRAHRVAHEIAQLTPPFVLFHNQIPQLTSRSNVVPSDRRLCGTSVHGSTGLTTNGSEAYRNHLLTVRPELCRRAPIEFSHGPPKRGILLNEKISLPGNSVASLIQPLDESLFDNPIDNRIVKKIVDRSFALALPIQNGLKDRWLHSRLPVEVLDGVLIGFVQRVTAAEQIFCQNFIGKFLPGFQ